jgi:hypothetical protein
MEHPMQTQDSWDIHPTRAIYFRRFRHHSLMPNHKNVEQSSPNSHPNDHIPFSTKFSYWLPLVISVIILWIVLILSMLYL